MKNVKLVGLTSGQFVICELEETEDGYVLTNPSAFTPTQQGVAIVPMNPFMKEEPVTIKESAVIYVANPNDEVVNKFKEAFSELALPPTNSLVLPS